MDDYSKKINFGVGNISTEEVMDKLDIFQAIFVNVDEFSWCYMEILKTDDGMKFTFQ